MSKRTAIVFGNGITEDRVAAFLPTRWKVVDFDVTGSAGDSVLIEGEDSAGWTLEGYVIPRLASGLMWAQEVDVEACDEVARSWIEQQLD